MITNEIPARAYRVGVGTWLGRVRVGVRRGQAGQVSRVRRNARVRAPSAPPVYSSATKSVTPASASAPIWAATVSSSPTMATSAGPEAPSRSSMARYDGNWP